jgi:hypothetical protein
MARPTELPTEPPSCLPTSATTLPATRVVTERVISRAMIWPVDSRWPRGRLVPKMLPSTEPSRRAGRRPPALARPAPCHPARSGPAFAAAISRTRIRHRSRVVLALDRALGDHRLALLRRQPAEPRRRRTDHGAVDHRRHAVAFQERYQRLALAELGDHLLGVELGLGRKVSRRGAHRALVARREGTQRVLHAVAELRQHGVRHVERVLRHEIDADALGADQPHHLLDLLQQRLRRVGEQQMRLVEEEHQLRLVRIADLGHFLEQLRHQPQQEVA